jgi:predicted RNase H-like HicB family nuclease
VFHACSDGDDFNAKVSRDKNQDLFRGAGVGKSTCPFDIHTIAKYLCTTSVIATCRDPRNKDSYFRVAVLTPSCKAPMIPSTEDPMKLKVVIESSEEGGFTVYVPSLPGCVSEGETEQEAMQNIREAIELYLEPVDDDLAGIGKDVREIVL